MIVHGTKDKIVNMKYIERAYQTYLKENADNSTQSKVVLKIIDGGKHMFSKKHDKIAMEYVRNFAENT